MFTLTYNTVVLNIEQIRGFEVVPVMNGPDKVCNQFTVHVTALFNPARNAFNAVQDLTAPVSRLNAGVVPAITHQAIRNYLLTPHRSLKLTVDSGIGAQATTDILVVANPPALAKPLQPVNPMTVATLDARNGPQPLYCVVEEIVGTRTYLINYGITTWINETQASLTNRPALISNRWSMTHAIDNTLHTVRTIQGEAVFDISKLALLGQRSDDYRKFFVFPVPAGFRRISVNVKGSADGASVEYEVIDVQQPVSVTANKVADIQLRVTHTYGKKGGNEALGTSFRIAGDMIGARSARGKVAAGLDALSTIISFIPWVEHKVEGTIFGTPDAKREDLLKVALVCYDRETGFPGGLDVAAWPSLKFASFDEKLKVLSFGFSVGEGPPSSGRAHVFKIAPGKGRPPDGMWSSDWGVPGVLDEGKPPTNNPPNSNQTRGTYTESLVTALIQTAGSPPSLVNPISQAGDPPTVQ